VNETLSLSSQDRDLSKMNSSAVEPQNLGLNITPLGIAMKISLFVGCPQHRLTNRRQRFSSTHPHQ